MSVALAPPVDAPAQHGHDLKAASSNASLDSFRSVDAGITPNTTSTPASTVPPSVDPSFKGQAFGPTKTPLTALTPKSKPPGPPKLTAEQEGLYSQVLEQVSKWTTVPETTVKDAKRSPLTEDERMWLTRECLLRYLRATSWNVQHALQRLESTISWRREYGANDFTADYISIEMETGKQCIMGWDLAGRPVLYMSPARQNTAMSDRQIHSMCYMIDRALELLPPGQETMCLLISFKNAKAGHVPNMAQARAALNILQVHNPERLGLSLISDLPWYVSAFLRLVTPFIDPVTKEKMKFQPNNLDYVPAETLLKERGGELEFEYDHSAYWPALTAETARRRDLYKERWIHGGKLVGEFEEYLRGGTDRSYGQTLQEKESSELASATEKLAVSQ